MTEKSLRIGITCYPTFGGSGVIATEIGMSMARRGHRVHFICYEVPRRLNRYMDNVFFHEVELAEYPLFAHQPYSIGLASKMVEVGQFEELDIFHVHYAVPHASSAYLARQVLGAKSPKIITTLHGTDITLVGNDRSYLPITRFSIVESDAITAPSLYLKQATYDKLNIPSSTKIDVIPNFVNTEKYLPLTGDERNGEPSILNDCPSDTRTLIHISNFRPVKRVGDVVKVFERVREKIPVHLVLIGDGPERSRIEREVRDMGLKDHVCFLGKQESFVEILRHSDVFLLPSETESFGLAALEAMSCGVPVVASNSAGLPEVIKHGETGYLADVGDIEQMAKHVLKLLENDDLYSSFSEQARKLAVNNFDEERVCSLYEDYYYRVLG